jgi:hypothetical protein
MELYPGINFEIPALPFKNSIAGYGLPQKKQKWTRNELPDNFDMLSAEEQFAFAELEDKRCTEGYWFYNNGVPTYITGDHYHYLNWCKLDVGYPDYRDVDRRWFYAWQVCVDDTDCLGLLYAKKRRDGFSYRAMACKLNKARKTFNGHFGMMSKTGEDVKDLFAKLIYYFQEYPAFFKPQVQSAEDVKKELMFKTPIQKVTHKTRTVTKEMSLNTKITWRNTKDNSYDGSKLQILTGDECGKMIGASFTKWFSIAKTCLMVGGRIIGKGMFGSSVNEAEHGGEEFKQVWSDSVASEKDGNNRTVSGLYRYFVPAYDGLEGFVDEYGMSVIEDPETPVVGIDGLAIKIGAKTYIENKLKSLRDKGSVVAYYEELRQFPRDEDDLFRDPANEQTIFDLDRLYAQVEHNQMANPALVRGNFEWRNGERDTEVVWQPTEKGKWLIYWKPKEINQKTSKYGKVAPVETNTGLFSLDPYSAVKTAGKKHSMAASHGFRKLDLMDEANSNCFVTEYWARPSDPIEVYEDMIKQCVYFGWKVLIERNVRNCFDYFRVRGYDNYLMIRPESTFTEHSEDREPGLPNFSEAVRVVLMETLQSYISNNIGFIEEKQRYGVMPFNNTLKDWIEFNPEKWTDYDLTVAGMIAVVGSKGLLPTKKVTKQSIELFKTYRNDGNRSYEYVPKEIK